MGSLCVPCLTGTSFFLFWIKRSKCLLRGKLGNIALFLQFFPPYSLFTNINFIVGDRQVTFIDNFINTPAISLLDEFGQRKSLAVHQMVEEERD